MAKPRPPQLYRVGRGFRRAAAVVVILIIAYLAFAGYSIFKLNASDVSGLDTIQPNLGNQSAGVSGELSITNPGVAPVNSISFNGQVKLQDGTTILNFRLPNLTLGPSQSGRLPFALNFEFQNNTPASTLLFQDNALHLLFALNVTYAYIFTASVLATGSFSWGAPFYNLTVAPGTPTVESNGSVSVPLAVAFSNHARFAVDGTMTASVKDASGATCGSGILPINAPGGENYAFAGTMVVSGSSCLATPSSVVLSFFTPGGSISVVFPPEVLA